MFPQINSQTILKGNQGEFELSEKKLGEGTAAMIFQGEWNKDSQVKQVAIKVHTQRVQQNECDLIMKMIKKPHKFDQSVRHYDFFFSDTLRAHCTILELADGNLMDLTKNREWSQLDLKMKNEKIHEILYKIASGVNQLHSQGLTHRDLKPENILLLTPFNSSKQNQIKLSDFGLVQQSDRLKTIGIGTACYMAPELYQGPQEYTNKVDIWSLGCIWYWLEKGSDLLENKNENGYNQQNINQRIQKLQCSEDEKLLMQKLLSVDANDRLNINQVLKGLESLNLQKTIQNRSPLEDKFSHLKELIEKNILKVDINEQFLNELKAHQNSHRIEVNKALNLSEKCSKDIEESSKRLLNLEIELAKSSERNKNDQAQTQVAILEATKVSIDEAVKTLHEGFDKQLSVSFDTWKLSLSQLQKLFDQNSESNRAQFQLTAQQLTDSDRKNHLLEQEIQKIKDKILEWQHKKVDQHNQLELTNHRVDLASQSITNLTEEFEKLKQNYQTLCLSNAQQDNEAERDKKLQEQELNKMIFEIQKLQEEQVNQNQRLEKTNQSISSVQQSITNHSESFEKLKQKDDSQRQSQSKFEQRISQFEQQLFQIRNEAIQFQQEQGDHNKKFEKILASTKTKQDLMQFEANLKRLDDEHKNSLDELKNDFRQSQIQFEEQKQSQISLVKNLEMKLNYTEENLIKQTHQQTKQFLSDLTQWFQEIQDFVIQYINQRIQNIEPQQNQIHQLQQSIQEQNNQQHHSFQSSPQQYLNNPESPSRTPHERFGQKFIQAQNTPPLLPQYLRKYTVVNQAPPKFVLQPTPYR